MCKMTPKRKRFVEEYLVDLNATQAAVRAGYSRKTAGSIGQFLLKNAEIQGAIQKAQEKRSARVEYSQDDAMRDYLEIVRRCLQKDAEHADDFQPNAAKGALDSIAKMQGWMVERKEVSGKDGGPIETHATGELTVRFVRPGEVS